MTDDPARHAPQGADDSLDVFAAERATIARQRAARASTRAGGIPLPDSPNNLTGLALSGGGIRSATFNLGVLQALNRRRLLGFDYLSTVSGGGYIGSWWSAWLVREREMGSDSHFPPEEGVETWRQFHKARADHAPHAPTPDPIHHVRLFSNYLTPRKGALSRDLWRAVTVISRNMVLTWAALLPILASAVMMLQALFIWSYRGSPASAGDLIFARTIPTLDLIGRRMDAALRLPVAFLVWYVLLAFAWLMLQRGSTGRHREGRNAQWLIVVLAALAITGVAYGVAPETESSGLALLSVPVMAVFAWRIWFTGPQPEKGVREGYNSFRDRQLNRLSRLQGVALVAAIVTAVAGFYAALGHELVKYAFFGHYGSALEKWAVEIGKYLAIFASAGSAIYTGFAGAPSGGAESATMSKTGRAAFIMKVAPVLVLAGLMLLISWVSHSAVVTLAPASDWIIVFHWIVQIGIVTMVLLALLEGCDRPRAALTAGLSLLLATALGFVGDRWNVSVAWGSSLALGLFAILVLLFVRRGEKAAPRGALAISRAEWLLIGAGIAATTIAAFGGRIVSSPDATRLLLGLVGCLWTAVMLIGWTADPNTLSLHTFYKMRLVRAYLGASNPKRRDHHAEDVTETKEHDDVPLTSVSPDTSPGPYHLVNACLNLTAGSDLVIAQRAAAPFLFSRHFCGSARTGFRPTKLYKGGTLTLGTAVAVSGAAASPVMGSQTPSTALSMLLACLNVRLGYWTPTPDKTDWESPQARLWPFYVLREFFAHTADTSRYCYVTDGGHFDNTGVYSLVERGCSSIVVTDCGADPMCVFDDLANLVRRCRIDFAAEIRFPDLTPFSKDTLAKNRQHFITGYVRYNRIHLLALGWTQQEILDSTTRCSDEDLQKLGWTDIRDDGDGIGVIVVIKPTLRDQIETDVNRYGQQYKEFPQQSTGDQWFDEAQFESYRRLGDVSGQTAAEEIRKQCPAVAF
jgi:hypothetical protein